MSSLENVRSQLTNRLEVLVERQGKLDRDLRRQQHPDSQERAQEAENDEVLADLETQALQEMEKIRRALASIDAGTYGKCRSCGEDISENRLAALPFAGTCIDCAS
jgi:DnaK suppressor protein